MDQSFSAPLFDYLFVLFNVLFSLNGSKGKVEKNSRINKMAKYQLLLIDEEDYIVVPVIVNEICRYDATWERNVKFGKSKVCKN